MLEKNQLKKDETIESLSKALEKQREKNDVQRRMMEWKVGQIEGTKVVSRLILKYYFKYTPYYINIFCFVYLKAFTNKLADNFRQHRLKQKYFYLWRRWLLERQKVKAEKACKKKAEDVCLDMATRYETKIKKVKIK